MPSLLTQLLRLASDLDRLVVAAEWDSAAVLIVNEMGRGLILKRGPTAPWMPNRWNLPGGSRDPGETSSKDVAQRECEEELGVHATHLEFYGPVHGADYVLHLYLAWGYSGSIRLNKAENTDMEWVSVEELDEYQFIPGLKEAIREALTAASR